MYVFDGKSSKVFDKYMKIWAKVSNIVKKNQHIYSQLIYNKKHLKAEKRLNTKNALNVFIYH